MAVRIGQLSALCTCKQPAIGAERRGEIAVRRPAGVEKSWKTPDSAPGASSLCGAHLPLSLSCHRDSNPTPSGVAWFRGALRLSRTTGKQGAGARATRARERERGRRDHYNGVSGLPPSNDLYIFIFEMKPAETKRAQPALGAFILALALGRLNPWKLYCRRLRGGGGGRAEGTWPASVRRSNLTAQVESCFSCIIMCTGIESADGGAQRLFCRIKSEGEGRGTWPRREEFALLPLSCSLTSGRASGLTPIIPYAASFGVEYVIGA